MSTILHRREMHVAITADEAGYELSRAPGDVQAAFFYALADESQKFFWAMQCRAIADELKPEQREIIAYAMEVLVEHLREVRECSACEGTGRVPDNSGNFPDRPGVTAGPCQEWIECPKCNGTKVE